VRLEGATCLLTGATGGIGAALAERLAEAGARLVLSARNRERLERLAATLPASAVAAVVACDVTTDAGRDALADAARLHGVSCLVNVSGSNRFGLLGDVPAGELAALVDVNLTAPMLLTRALLPELQRADEALIVNVGSTFGSIGFPGYVAYCATKFGLRGFTEALARELADSSVRVLHVAPRATRTTMNSSAAVAMNAALGNAEDDPARVAQRIVGAMRKGRRQLVIGWPEGLFVRINQILPRIVDGALRKQLPLIKRHATQQG
jgi:short-subunit dehydrogenase